jgi:aspartyl-tRNA(Asn)/glutamyl-tRNA(Gln) amidotransferase subunit A
MKNILSSSLTDLVALVKSKTVSAKEINTLYHERSSKFNTELNTYVTLAPDVDSTNIQLAVKDNFCTKGMRTTASAKVLDGFVPEYSSTVTDRLHTQGLGVLGKTNMDAWAHGSSTETSDYGPSKNPWDVSKMPGGSSGGSAVAVAAGLSVAAIGSETAGSIRLPASWCGVVGLKPTYGRVSRYGVVAMGSSLDCPGPLTRTVEDAAYLLGLIAGHDQYDATSSEKVVGNYSELMKSGKKYKIGVPQEYLKDLPSDVRASIDASLKLLEKLGHTVKPIHLLDPAYSISVYTILQRAEVSSNLGRYDGIRYGAGRDTFGEEAKRRIMLGTYTLAHGYYDAYYKKAQKVRTLIIDDFNRAFHDVDLIAGPATPVTALPLGDSEKYPFFGELMDRLAEPSSLAGLPAISIPCGLDQSGMPIGLQLMGPQFEEGRILDLAHQYEHETGEFDGIIEKGLSKWV